MSMIWCRGSRASSTMLLRSPIVMYAMLSPIRGATTNATTTTTATGAPATYSSPSSSTFSSSTSVSSAKKRQAPVSTAVHKLSQNTADAAYAGSSGDDVPLYSASKHWGYMMLHSRRIWVPALLSLGYLAVAGHLTALQAGLYATAAVVVQRINVRGAVNHASKDMSGYTCVVSGGTSGIGLYTALQLLNMGARVVICAPPGKEDDTMAFFEAQCKDIFPGAVPLKDRVSFIALNYMDQLDIVAAAARVKALCNDRVDLLVNCAGVWREEPTLTRQHVEEHIGVNFLGPFHFTEALLPSLRKAPHHAGRVVYVVCASHNGVSRANVVRERMLLQPGPDQQQITARCYSASKLGNIYHAQSIANRRYEGIPLNRPSELHPVDVCCADPGFCATALQQQPANGQPPLLGTGLVARTLRSLWIKDAYEGSQTVVNCCIRDDIENGSYYAECRHLPSGLSRRAMDSKSRDEVVHWAMGKTIAKYYKFKKE